MGSTVSQLSREEVQKKSLGFTRIYSYIFDFMLKELKIEDVLQLNSSDYCKRYIMFMGDALYQFFQKIQLDPNKTDKGTIYFKKIDEMIPKGSMMEQQKIGYCRQIAFFYLRLFQIYSALALSVIDQANIVTSNPQFKRQLQPQIPGARPLRQMGGDAAGLQSFWGSINNEKLNIFDKNKKRTIRGTSFKYLLSSDDNTKIYIAFGKFIININNRDEFYGEYTISLNNNKYVIKITKINRSISGGTIQYKDKDVKESFGTREILRIEESPNNLREYFISGIIRLEDRLRKDKKDAVRDTSGQYRFDTSQQYRLPYTSYSGSTSLPQDIKTLMDSFRTMRTQPYCMARALQLLRQDTLETTTTRGAYTSICATKFEEAGKGIVPLRDGPISESMGLKALSSLFFDTLETGTPKLSTNSIILYKNFLKNLETLFEDTRSSSSDYLGGIKSKSPKGCVDKKISGIAIIKDQGVINDTKKIIMKLYEIQVRHAAGAQKIINKLFDVNPQGVVYLTKAVTEGGIPYLNKIAGEARELLIKYYEQCEGYYALGAHEMFSDQAKLETF